MNWSEITPRGLILKTKQNQTKLKKWESTMKQSVNEATGKGYNASLINKEREYGQVRVTQ